MKLRLQIQLNGHRLLAIFGLPPPQLPLAERGHDVVHAVTVALVIGPGLPRVAGETLGVLLQVTDDAVVLGPGQATGGGGGQVILPPDQEISSGGVTTSLLASWLPLRERP